ncbi:MAG: sodium:solute symporter family protein [Planctomycetales bacterium]|nr:sodium:solute symporter family protein [Planctomycetales bacterium]
MLTVAVLGYLLFTVGIGFYASSRVHGAKDFMVAGRSLPLYMNFTCVFATWFGAETVLSVSATFAKGGLVEIPGDPFGAAMCLVLVAVFFARAFYRMDLLTIGDFYHKKYGKIVEVFTSIAITLSYLGWTAAQLTALGLVLFVLGQQAGLTWLLLDHCIIVGAVVVMIYTVFGGMWSVALTDMIQTVVIIVGLIIVAYILSDIAGGADKVIESAYDSGRLRLFPKEGIGSWLTFIAGFLTVALGSIPQQDVFQRVTSAKNEKTAVRGTLLGGSFYFLFAFVPMFIAYSAVVITPETLGIFEHGDERHIQRVLPELILNQTPFWAQAIFFGALLSAILSTASGTLLAPASLFTENVLRPFLPDLQEKNMLVTLRSVLILFGIAATWHAAVSNDTMYQMVQGAYSVTLVGALVPLAAGIYWSRSTTQGALASIVMGMGGWGYCLYFHSDVEWLPAQLVGLVASVAGMLMGSLMPQYIPNLVTELPLDALNTTNLVDSSGLCSPENALDLGSLGQSGPSKDNPYGSPPRID